MNSKNWGRILCWGIFLFCCSCWLNPWTVMAQSGRNIPVFSDLEGHWAEETIKTWLMRGYVQGYPDGKFRPDQAMTRAEFCALLNRVFGLERESVFLGFTDVTPKQWFSHEIYKAVTAGYFNHDAGGFIRPNEIITRQEVAIVFAKILALKAVGKDHYSKFADLGQLTLDEAMAINTMIDKKYMLGHSATLFFPQQGITRAEILAILDRSVGTLYDSPGVFGPPYEQLVLNGNVTVTKSNVTLRNMYILGDLNITEGVGEGSVTLVNVTVKGTTKVSGGVILNNYETASILVSTLYRNRIRLLAQGTSKIGVTEVRTGVKLEETNLVGSGFNDVIFKVPQGAKIELVGDFKKVNLEGTEVQLDFLRGTMDALNLSLAARGAEVNLSSLSHLKQLQVINRAKIKGWGTIAAADVYANNVTFEQVPHKLTMAPGVSTAVRGRVIWGAQTAGSSAVQRVVPHFSDHYPRVGNVCRRDFDVFLKANEDCRAYYVVLYSGESVPGAIFVLAGEDARGNLVSANRRGMVNLTANKEKRITIEDLEVDTQYNVFLVLENWGVSVDPAVIKLAMKTKG